MERKTNWLAIVVAVVVAVFIGFLWYGMFFTDMWMAGNGITMEGEKVIKNGVEMPMTPTPMIFNVIGMIVYALVLNWLVGLTGTNSWAGGAKLGGAIGLLMIIGITTGNLFAARPSSLTMVDGSYSLVQFIVMGAIIGGWPKR